MADIGLVARRVEVGDGLCGLARLENKIFVTLKESKTIFAFWEKRPFIRMEHENIEIQGLKDPRDLAASIVDTSLFVSDPDSKCLWKVRVPDKKVSKVEMRLSQKIVSFILHLHYITCTSEVTKNIRIPIELSEAQIKFQFY